MHSKSKKHRKYDYCLCCDGYKEELSEEEIKKIQQLIDELRSEESKGK